MHKKCTCKYHIWFQGVGKRAFPGWLLTGGLSGSLTAGLQVFDALILLTLAFPAAGQA